MKGRITDYLLVGKENATSGEILCEVLSICSKRELNRAISKARIEGEIICSSPDTKGYYLPSCKADLEEFVTMMENYANTTLKAIQSAKKKLEEYNEM